MGLKYATCGKRSILAIITTPDVIFIDIILARLVIICPIHFLNKIMCVATATISHCFVINYIIR